MRAEVLSEKDMNRIHDASMRILGEVGVVIPHPDMLSRMEGAGAKVDHARRLVRIPEKIVMRLVGGAGKEFTIGGRDPAKTAMFGKGRLNFNSISGEAYWVDEPGKPRRFPSIDDVATAARLGDALPNIDIAGAMADPHELPVEARCVRVLATLLRNTTKPVGLWFHDRASARFIVEMLVALRGDEKRAAAMPACYPFFEPISPLRFPFNGIDLLYETARLNLPVPVGPMAQAGVSAPVTLAGTIAQESAEILAGICITQLVKPGLPVCYGGICHAYDMRTTQMIFCGPEQAIFGVAMTQMGKHYRLPVYINVGLADSKRPDAQAGLEIASTLVLGAAAGADIFGHMGISGVDQATSLDMLVLQDEIIGFVKRAVRPLEVNDESLAFDAIREVGPGGTFLDHETTLAGHRREIWSPRLLDRQYYEAWLEGGAGSAEERCAERKRELLSSHKPEPVPADLDREFERIATSAERELAEKS
jgi:trimethylamine--corrinoid protein Co-methyltransferase